MDKYFFIGTYESTAVASGTSKKVEIYAILCLFRSERPKHSLFYSFCAIIEMNAMLLY